MSVEGKRVLVTGGNRGLGRELAFELSNRGCSVVTCGRAQAPSIIPGVTYRPLDLGSVSAPRKLVEEATREMGGLDILVNNASITHPLKRIEELDQQQVNEVFTVNVFAILELIRNVVPIMKSQKNGLIINIASFCGRRAVRWLSAYCASKFAVRGLTEGAAQEFEFNNYGIKCISVSPGGMNTAMRSSLFGEEDARRQQDPKFVAAIIGRIIFDDIHVPNGADIVVRGGQFSIKVPES